MADELLNASLPPVSWTTGTASRGNRQESAANKEGGQGGKAEVKKPGPAEPGDATEQIEADEHELDSFA